MNETSVIYFLYSAGLLFSNFIYADLTSKTEDSWIKSTLGGLPTEISGSIIERNYELIKSKLKKSFPQVIRDNKDTLYKSVRRAQLQALKDVGKAYRDEIKETKSEKYNLEYIKGVEDYIREEEAKITRGDFQDLVIDDALTKQIIANNKLPGNIQADSRNVLLKELPKSDTLPTRFVEMLQNGWQKGGVNHNLFERFEVHFNAELAKPEVANVLFKNAFNGIQITLDELAAGQENQTDLIKELTLILEQKAKELENLGYRILYKNNGEAKGFEFIGEKLNRIEDKIDEIKKLIEADKNLTPEERQAKERELIDKYLAEQIKDYPIAEVVGEIYSADKFFVDREEEKRNLPDWLLNNEKIVVIRGISGDGKTALMTEVLRAIVTDENKITSEQVKGILTFYFRDFSGKVLAVNLLDICRKADARLAKDNIKLGFALQYEEFRKVNPFDVPVQIIANLCRALNSLGDIWFIFDNFESALQNGEIKDKEIEALMIYALQTQPHLRFLITSQVLPVIPNVANIRQCPIADLPADFAKEFLWKKGQALKENGTDCGLDEATSDQFDELFTKLLPTPISLVSLVAYLETICETKGKVFEDVLADESLFVSYRDFDADDKNKGARVLIRRQYELLSEVEQLILKALSIFSKAIEFPVLQSILPLSLEEETLRRILKSNSLVRKVGRHLYELLPLPKEVIAKQFEQNEKFNHTNFNIKAAMFYSSVHKPVAECYTLEDFDTYFKEIEHCYQAGIYKAIVMVINQIMPKTTPLGMMNETLTRSRRIEKLLVLNSEAKANNHFNIGLSLHSLGKLNEAIVEYDKAIEILQDLVENKGRSELANDLATAYMNKGVSLRNLGKLNEAIVEFDIAIEILQDLVKNQGRSELANDLATAYMNKGSALEKNGDSAKAVEMFSFAISLWESALSQGFVHNLPNLVKALRIRVTSLIKLENWAEITSDAIKSLYFTMKFLQNENFSEHFKQQIGGEFGGMLYQIKQISQDNRERIFTIANETGQMQEDKIPYGDILREYIEQTG